MIKVGLIFEAMICVVTEVFEVYSRICRGIARSLVRVYASPQGKKAEEEARLALAILRKARDQGDDLSLFFDLCREMGVLNPSCSPRIEQIPEDDLRELERIINGISKSEDIRSLNCSNNSDHGERLDEIDTINHVNEKAIVVFENDQEPSGSNKNNVKALKTIVTDKWEVFDEEVVVNQNGVQLLEYHGFLGSDSSGNIVHDNMLMPSELACKRVLPDLISF